MVGQDGWQAAAEQVQGCHLPRAAQVSASSSLLHICNIYIGVYIKESLWKDTEWSSKLPVQVRASGLEKTLKPREALPSPRVVDNVQ